MASFKKQKEALRAAVLAYIAGAHSVTEEVERMQSVSELKTSSEMVEARHSMLASDYSRLFTSTQAIEMFVDVLDEEDLYPFGSEWPREAIIELVSKIFPPKLSLETGVDAELRFRYRAGFKKLLSDFASSLESHQKRSSSLDHWMALLLNTAFHAGATVAARNAEGSKIYYQAVQQLEEEVEPWGRYPQLVDLLERQLRRETRRRTGLVSDLDY